MALILGWDRADPETTMQTLRLTLFFALVVAAGPVFIGCSPPLELAPEHRQAIEAGFRHASLPQPTTIEANSSRDVVATFQIDDDALAQMVAAGIKSPREFAERAVLTVRNAMLPFKVSNSYRVDMNGPSPGPGLIWRYGSAGFIEGGAVSWEPGPPK